MAIMQRSLSINRPCLLLFDEALREYSGAVLSATDQEADLLWIVWENAWASVASQLFDSAHASLVERSGMRSYKDLLSYLLCGETMLTSELLDSFSHIGFRHTGFCDPFERPIPK